MKIKLTQKTLILGLSGIFGLAIFFALILASVDYYQYRTTAESLSESEQRQIHGELERLKHSADELLHLLVARVKHADEDQEKLQRILSSAGQLAVQLELPVVLSAKYRMFSKPGLEVTRFGTKHLNGSDEDANSLEQAITLNEESFIAREEILGQNQMPQGLLTLKFKVPRVGIELKTLLKTSKDSSSSEIFINGLTYYVVPPASFWEYFQARSFEYVGFWFMAFFMLVTLVATYTYVRAQFRVQYEDQIQRLKKDISGFVISEYKHQSYFSETQALKKIQARLSQQQKEQANHIHIFLAHFLKLCQGSESFTDEEQHLFNSCLASLEALSAGLCSPLHNNTVSMIDILRPMEDLFSSTIQSKNINFEIDCSPELTSQGDLIFLQLILLNIIGRSLYRVYQDGFVHVHIVANEMNLEVCVTDSGEVLSHEAEGMIERGFTLFIENKRLVSICRASGILIKLTRESNRNVTTVVLQPTVTEESSDNVVALFQ